MNVLELPARVVAWLGALPLYTRILLSLATTMMVVELVLRRFARGTKVYAAWTHGLERVGMFWTAILLSIVYFVSVAGVGLGLRLLRKDPLDRTLAPEPSFWRSHEPNPLGPRAASRHQF